MSIQHHQASNSDALVWDALWLNAKAATMHGELAPYGLIENAAIGISKGKIVFVGDTQSVPQNQLANCQHVVDCQHQLVTPGLIDCHTHLVYAGNRASEFELRLNGASYEEIARAGGGILSTVSATRAASIEELACASSARLESLMAEGVTTIEIKSGYGLDTATEIKMLTVAKQLGHSHAIDVHPTFLGAHALPTEFRDRSDAYIERVVDEMLPTIATQKLATSVDAFCENIGFTPQQVEKVLRGAKGLGLSIKLHAEQLSDLKGAKLAAELGALSVDHLEYLDPNDIPSLKRNNTVAVLLPGAFYFLRETKLPPISELRQHGVPMAIASDSNPGSSPVNSLLLMLNMACTLFRMTPEEALLGVTKNAARALGIEHRAGSIALGKDADLVLWDLTHPAELSYTIGGNPCLRVMFKGVSRA